MNLRNNWKKLLRLLKPNKKLKTEDIISRKIRQLARDDSSWQSVLNREATWLFAAHLGVWGIPVSPLASHRLLVSTLLLVLFSARIEGERKKRNRTESFPKTISKIELQIRASNLDEKAKKALLYDLNNVRANITGKSAYKNTWIFTICWCYCTIVCWFLADTVLVSIQDRLIQSLQ